MEEDDFLLEHFFPIASTASISASSSAAASAEAPILHEHKYDENNPYILGQYGYDGPPRAVFREFVAEIKAELIEVNKRIELLKRIRQRFKELKNESVIDDNADLTLDMKKTHKLAYDIKFEYCASVATRAIRHILEYQNKAPWAAFEKKVPAPTKSNLKI